MIDLNHLSKNKESYFSHFKFAAGIGINLFIRSVFFLIHGFVPIIQIPKIFNINCTLSFIENAKKYTDEREK